MYRTEMEMQMFWRALHVTSTMCVRGHHAAIKVEHLLHDDT